MYFCKIFQDAQQCADYVNKNNYEIVSLIPIEFENYSNRSYCVVQYEAILKTKTNKKYNNN